MDFSKLFNRNYANLTEAASNLDDWADKLENAFDFTLGLVDQAETVVSDLIVRFRDTAEAVRAEAATKTDGIFDDVAPNDANPDVVGSPSRDEKVQVIVDNLKGIGAFSKRWDNPTDISDVEVERYWRLFGGK